MEWNTKWEYTESELWRHNDGYVTLYHSFGLCVTAKGTILAYCDARYGDGSDGNCDHEAVFRRSVDNGRSFEPAWAESFGLDAVVRRQIRGATLVSDLCSGRVFAFVGTMPNASGQDERGSDLYLSHSDDDGLTWSKATHCTQLCQTQADHADHPFHHTVGSHGIQIQEGPYAGRLLMPIYHRRLQRAASAWERGYCVSTLYSDDGGTTWQDSPGLRGDCLNEWHLCETPDGLYAAFRSETKCLFDAVSADGGITWGPLRPHPSTATKPCNFSLASLSAPNGYDNTILLLRPSRNLPNYATRLDMEVLISRDNGHTFTERMELPRGDAMPGYSDLAVLRDGGIGMLHVRCDHVVFSRVSLQALTGGRFTQAKRTVWK